MAVTLYNMTGSAPCTYVRVVAKKAGVFLNLHEIDIMAKDQLKPEFIKLNPLHTVPTMDDNGFLLWESRAIAFYLLDKYAPDSPLYPKDPQRRAEINKLVFFEYGNFHKAQMALFHRRWFNKQDLSQDIIQGYEKALGEAVTLLADKKFLTGDSVTLADIGLATSLGTAIEVDEYEGLSKYPKLVEYYKRVKSALPEYEEVASEGHQLLKGIIAKAPTGPHGPSGRK